MAVIADEPRPATRSLDARAEECGRKWADSVRGDLVREGRRAAGGWPGTMSEARTRLDVMVQPGARTSPTERERLARLLYGAARESWLVNRDARDED